MRLFSFYANLTPNSKPGIWMAGMLENIKTVQYNDDLINHWFPNNLLRPI